jgi:sacsin
MMESAPLREGAWERPLAEALALAEALGAPALGAALDCRAHAATRLLQPSQAALQGPSLCLLLPGLTLDDEAVVALTQPAARLPKSTTSLP